ncbi:OmpA family protein [Lysobacter firmicutimachus]|uniref:OmpA family protein n=1 Tax=Lysobacter firmicutimachus TaxID=1792846 RepID=A0AAU8N304_9GAMM
MAATIGRRPDGTGGTPIDCNAPGNDCREVTPIINVVKTLITGGPTAAAGETLVYQIQLTNSGTATATIPAGGIAETVPTATTAAAGDSFSCAAGAAAGTSCTNTAAVTVPAGGAPVNLTFRVTVDNPLPAGTASIVNAVALPQFVDCTSPGNDCSETTPTSRATLTLVKTVTNNNGGTATINDFPLTATGPTTITGVSGTATVTNASVAPGTYVLSETNVAGYTAGTYSCVVNGGAAASGNSVTLADGDTATCTIVNDDQGATLTLVKTVTNDNGGTATINDFPLTATGPTTITGVSGTAAVTNAPVSAGGYTLSEANVAGYTAGTFSCVVNGGAAVSGNSVTLALGDAATCTINNNDQAATLTLVKTVTNDNGGTATINDFPLTATGPTTITGVSGTAAVTNASVSAGVYTLTEANVAGYTAGAWSCTAGTLSGNSLTLPAGASATCTIVNDDTPATQTIVKAVTANADQDGSGTVSLGDTLTYTVTVTNTSTTANLLNVVVSDNKITPTGGTTPCASVAPGNTCTLIGTYVVTAADVTAGNVVNTATSTSSVCPAGSTDPTCTTTVTTPVIPLSQSLVKSLTNNADQDGSGTVSLGDTLTYTVTMTNTSASGNLTNVVVSDSKITPSSTTCATVAPGATCLLTGTYVVTAADVTAGNIVNTATSTSPVCPAGSTSPSCTRTVTTPVTSLSQSLAKAVTANADEDGSATVSVGDTLTYTVTLTNTSTSGNLTNVVVSDNKITPSSTTCATVAPNGGTCVLTGTYVVTATDATAGNIVNTATVTSPVCPAGSTDPGCTTTVTTPVPPRSQTLAKALTGNADEDASGTVTVGDTLTYTVTMTNTSATGNLTNVVVRDNKISPNSRTCATVAPGATCVLTGTYVVTAADVTAGSIVNTATVTSPICPVGSTDPACTTTVTTPVASLSQTLAKALTGNADEDGSGTVSLGDTLTYTITLTNTSVGGNLTNVVVSDNKIAPSSTTCATVAPGATCVLTGTYVVKAADVSAGNIVNTATSTSPVCPAGSTDPACTTTVTTPVASLSQTLAKALTGNADEDRSGTVSLGDTLTYTVTLTNTSVGGNLSNVVVSDNKITPSSVTCATVAPGATCVLTGTYVVTAADVSAGSIVNIATSTSPVCPAGSTDPACTATVTTPVIPAAVRYAKSANTAGPVVVGDAITYTLTATISGGRTLGVTTLTDTLGTGLDFVAVTGSAGYACNAANPLVCTLPAGTAPGTYTVTYTARVNAQASETVDNAVVGTGTDNPTCQGSCITSTPVVVLQSLRVIKQASPRDVKIGDLVRYTVTVENTGSVDAIDATLVDTPPAGFSFVDGSLSVADRDGAGRLVGTYPIQVDQVDIAAGERATFTYLLRVGAGVRPGIHTNHALMRDNGRVASNEATANVQLIADPLLDESLILGTVFDDRDGDGWQDSAAMDGIKVQGGFAPEAYVANSTTVDRGAGPTPEPDASSPMLHGIALGSIAGRQSDADPVSAHTVVIRQRLNALSFNDEFTLTTQQGVTVRMDAAGATRIERSGDAAKNLTAAAPTVERRVSQGEGGYVVDYVVSNTGVDERGIPGVRIASVEGLLMETDQFGRYHLEGVDVGTLERGRNFILKVDPATLPPGSVFTTDNPLVRRVTPGLPVRFDWGVKLPAGLIEGGEEQVEMELGEVFFAPGSAEVRAQYLPAVEKMAEQVKRHRGGEVVIVANGDTQSLAFDRASAVKDALIKQLPADVAQALKVSVRGDADDPGSLIVGLGEGGALLGTVLFDTDKSTIKPQFEPLLDKVAKALDSMKGGVIAIVGHTDVRASYEYNTALGMRRAKAVYEALAQRLSPEVRAKVRVESSNDPTAPVGAKRN